VACKEAANENDESRKRFEVMCREVFKKFKACINVQGVNEHRSDRDAINIVYKSLQQDREQADIIDIIRQLHAVVDEAIEVQSDHLGEDNEPYDISKIDFDRLRKEFERSPRKNTTVQNLRQAVEQRLQRLLMQNPLRTDFQQHYENIVTEYNREKDRVTIEKTFEALFRLDQELDDEAHRSIREGLDEESLAIFDLLRKSDLNASDIKRIKGVAVELLERLKAEMLRVDHWRDKESTRDAVKVTIRNFLWEGLPTKLFADDDVDEKVEEVFRHVYRAYPILPSPYYSASAV
jgi:type I restriction enzyme R subunit